MPQCLHRTAASLKAMKPNFRCPSASDRKCPQVTWREVGVACCYLVLAAVAVVVTYELVETMRFSLQHPVRSANYRRVEEYDAPGIAIYPGGATFPACNRYFQNVVTSKVRLSQLDLENRTCRYVNLTYSDPHYPNVTRNALVIRGPSQVLQREATFLHFRLEDASRDFFTVSYFLFPGWDRFSRQSREEQIAELSRWHEFVPTFALGAGFRFWTKISVKETFFLDQSSHIDFKTEYSVIRHWDRRPPAERSRAHLFFIFFEWKNNIVEQSYLLYTTSPWSIGAGLCGVFLTLHKAYTLLQASVHKLKKEKRKDRLAHAQETHRNHVVPTCSCTCQVHAQNMKIQGESHDTLDEEEEGS